MNTSTVFEAIEKNYSRYVDFLCEICSFEARARDKKEIDEMNDRIIAFAEKEGFTVKRTSFEKCGDFLTVEMNEGSEKGGLFLAHTDTVHEKGAFGYPAVKKTEKTIIGPGVSDCKGGIAVAMLAAKSLVECGYKKHIRLILTSDEEVSNSLGGEKEKQFFYDSSVGFPCAVNCETTGSSEVVISRKGILRFKITVKGVSGHSGINYFESRNAIVEAAHKIIALESKSVYGGTTYSCNIINGGEVGNIVPDVCVFYVDIRVVDEKGMEEAEKTFYEIVDKHYVDGTSAEAEPISKRPPMEKNKDSLELFEKLNEKSEKYGLGTLIPIESGGGSDSCYTQKAGVPSICGMGPCGGKCHTVSEFIYTESISDRAKLIAAFLNEE